MALLQAEGNMARSLPQDEPRYRWLEPPGIYCDAYTANYFPSGVIRITFGEYIDKDHYPYFRTAVVIPLSDAKRLVRTLNRLITRAEQPSEPDEPSSEA